MGFFKRVRKKEEEKEVSEITPIKTPEEIQKERVQNELEFLQNEITVKNEKLESISEKLSSVKKEYDEVIGNLMAAKKEWNEKKDGFESLKKIMRKC